MDHLVPLLKIPSILNNAVSCFAERSSRVQQRVSYDSAFLVGFFVLFWLFGLCWFGFWLFGLFWFYFFFCILQLELANYYSSGKEGQYKCLS